MAVAFTSTNLNRHKACTRIHETLTGKNAKGDGHYVVWKYPSLHSHNLYNATGVMHARRALMN